MTTTSIRGGEFAHEQAGTGIDVVWGHGLTQNRRAEDVRPFVDWTAIDARTLRYDARGHGESSSTLDLAGYSWDQLALDQLELTRDLGIDHYIAAGASMGAATALHAAVIAPERVDGLILVIPPTGWETRAAQIDQYEQGAKAIDAFGVDALVTASALTPPPDPLADDPDHRARRADELRSWDPVRLARVLRGAATAQLPSRDDIAAISCPTLVLAWTGDAGHPESTARELGRLLPHADVHLHSTAAEVSRWTERVSEFLHARRVDGHAHP